MFYQYQLLLFMKRKTLFISMVAWGASAMFSSLAACTNMIVGKKASADGSVMVSYNADSYGMYGNVYSHKGGVHAKGEMRKVYEWDTNKYLGEIPQAERTYNVVAQMNELQVSITETTFGGRKELWDTDGKQIGSAELPFGIDYGSLIYIALERSTSAREAIQVMTSLVEQHGYCSEGETFSICDKNEAWVMELIGKGAGEKGAVWVAVRIPDDCVSGHANQSRITRLSQFDKKQMLRSKDLISFARKKGYFSGKDADFSFRDAYAPNDFGAVRYCEARVWSLFNRCCDGMDQYVEYAKGNDQKGEMPLYMKPRHLIKVQEVMDAMRDHYENTPFDIRNELGAGPYNMPYRPTPLEFKVGDKTYFNERPISTQQTSFSFVGQMRDQYPDAIGGIAWVTNDDPNMTPFVPLYCGISEVPRCFRRVEGKQDDATFSWESAFWVQNTVSNMVYPYYDKMFPDVLRCRKHIETFVDSESQYAQRFKEILEKAGAERLTAELTETSNTLSERMLSAWTDLFQYLVVKHLDMAVKKVDEQNPREFKRTAHGLVDSPIRPGYPEPFIKRVMEETGEKYLMK